MRRYALFGPLLWGALVRATPHLDIRVNSTTPSSKSTTSTFAETDSAHSIPVISISDTATASINTTSVLTTEAASASDPTSTSTSSSSVSPAVNTTSNPLPIPPPLTSTVATNSSATTSTHSTDSTVNAANASSTFTRNSSTTADTICTGCVLEAFRPKTITADEILFTTWEPVTVTVTVINKTITYMDGTNIDTIVTEYETLTKNLTLPANQTVVTTTPIFTWVPVVGTTLTLNVGPTYVAYTNIWGGLDKPWTTELEDGELEPTSTEDLSPEETRGLPLESSFPEEPEPAEETCDARIREVPVWPTQSEDYQYFIVTYTDSAPGYIRSDTPVSLPPALIEHLRTEPAITSVFKGSDIATCTLRSTRGQTRTFSGTRTPPGETPPASTESPPPMIIPTTSSYISEVYQTTSAQVTVQGCLRCDRPLETATPENPDVTKDHIVPPSQTPVDPPPPASRVRPPPEPPVSKEGPPAVTPPDNARATHAQPQDPPSERPDSNDRQSITVGDSVFQVRPAHPTQAPNTQKNPDPNRPQVNQQQPSQNPNPNIVLGTDTLTPGQTTTINGVQVIVPSNAGNGNTNIIVNSQTIAVTPLPTTGPPLLTVGSNTLTANPQGQFFVGTQTLVPGGTPVTVDGSTLSLGPSGTIAVVNGVTQTLANAPLPTNFNAPALTVNGQTIPATVIGGTSAFVLGPGQTLTPGGVLTVAGTTFSMPSGASGSTILVNGVPTVLPTAPPGEIPALTLGSQTLNPSLLSGTTAFVLAPGQTLTPGGQLTVSGTTFSLPESGSGSVVVINGQRSTFGISPLTAAPALTIDGTTVSPIVRDGTTEYVISPGVTLKPGEVVTVSGTTYSLDESGSALVVDGTTSSIVGVSKTGPARNSAVTTRSGTASASGGSTITRSTTGTNTTTSTTSSERDPGDFIASGVGVTKKGGAGSVRVGGGKGVLEGWVEGALMWGLGWMVVFF